MATVSLQAVYDQARRLLESGDADRASAVAQHILRTFPHDLEAHRLLGEAYLADRQFEQAQSAFQTVLFSDPENIPAYVGLGVTHERLGQLDQAIGAFEHALEIKPDMAELRSQLLRLYTETWGSENAQLRLSRVGLARLYAKGHMLPQAIQEFRSVITEQPDRFDARVALVEVLWRDGQEDAAVAACEESLAERSELLKPNLVLGYTLLASGDPRGDQYWNTAFDLDPYQTMAHTLFDQLPNSTRPQPTIAEWDEQEWQAQRTRQPQSEPASAFAEPRDEPVAATATQEDDFFGGSWMDTIGQSETNQEMVTTGDTDAEDDDFLSRLLAFEDLPADADLNEGVVEPAQPATSQTEDEPEMQPFSLADLGLTDDEIASLNGPASTAEEKPATAQDYDTRQFSLADLDLDDEQSTTSQTPPEVPAPPAETPTQEQPRDTQVFSLDDLGLDDTSAPSNAAPTMPSPAQPDQTDEEADLTPFSLSDLGLTDDEIASLDTDLASEPAPSATTRPGQADDESTAALHELGPDQASASNETSASNDLSQLKPFSFDDWSLDQSETSELQPFSLDDLDITNTDTNNLNIGALPSSLQPFSLDDLDETPPSPSARASASLNQPRNEEAGKQSGEFSFRQQPSRPTTDSGRTAEPSEQPGGSSIFAKLKQRRGELPTEEPPPLQPVADDEMDMNLFAHSDDVSLRDASEETAQPESSSVASPSEPAPSPAEEEPDMTPFSLSDLGLSPEEIASLGLEEQAPAASAPAETQPAAPASPTETEEEPDMTPFSLSDLGLSPEEIASLGLEEPAPAASATPASAETQSAAHAPSAETEEEPDMTPFSLSDLGLSPEEIASLGLDSNVASGATTPSQGETTAEDDFDFDMLGETPSSTGLDSSQMLEEQLDSDLQPFSLDDLGLTDEDLSPYGLGGSGSELGLTDDELNTMDLGALEQSRPTSAAVPSSDTDTYEVDTGDPTLDRLITLGRRQGFVDLTDIISAVKNPEEEADRIEEMGQVLHRAGIQIRDGDEIIDMDEIEELDELGEMELSNLAEADETFAPSYQDTQTTGEPASSEEEPDMTPFSLSDLGLSPEEIASFGLEEPAPAASATPASSESQPVAPATPSADEEPDMTPFSLSDLGLSPEEIASLGLDQEEAQSAATPAPAAETPEASAEPAASQKLPAETAADEEPDMTPFSLSDLGLSPEEIASLGLDQEEAQSAATPAPAAETPEASAQTVAQSAATPAAEATAAPAANPESAAETSEEEPDMTPFSLSDLGLSPEEIASLGLEDTNAAAASQVAETSEEEPDMTPFSLSDLGLSPEEIASLDLPAADATSSSATSDEHDVFDFSAVDEAPRPSTPSTPRVREEEPPPPESPEDAAFVAEPLESLDSIWEELPAPASHAAPLAPAPAPVQSAPAPAPEQSAPPQAPSERVARIERIERTPRPAPVEPKQTPAERPAASREPARATPPQPTPPAPTQPAPARPAPQTPSASGTAQPARSESWRKRESSASMVPTGDETLDSYLQQLDAEPNNDVLRLAVARIGGQSGRLDLAMQQYKILTRANRSLDQVEDDLHELIDDTEDPKLLQRLYRVLGDVYTKQNRFRDAVEAYSWTFGK